MNQHPANQGMKLTERSYDLEPAGGPQLDPRCSTHPVVRARGDE